MYRRNKIPINSNITRLNCLLPSSCEYAHPAKSATTRRICKCLNSILSTRYRRTKLTTEYSSDQFCATSEAKLVVTTSLQCRHNSSSAVNNTSMQEQHSSRVSYKIVDCSEIRSLRMTVRHTSPC